MPADQEMERAKIESPGKLIITSRAPFTARKTRAALRRTISGARITRPGFKSVFVLESPEEVEELACEVYFGCAPLIGHVTAVLAEVESDLEPVKQAAVKIGVERIHLPESFAFRLNKRGSHKLHEDTPQIENEIGGAIKAALEEKSAIEPLVNLEDPDVTVVAEVLGPITLVGISRKLWQRTSRIEESKLIEPVARESIRKNKETNGPLW